MMDKHVTVFTVAHQHTRTNTHTQTHTHKLYSKIFRFSLFVRSFVRCLFSSVTRFLFCFYLFPLAEIVLVKRLETLLQPAQNTLLTQLLHDCVVLHVATPCTDP